ncbi:MAG: tRNA pseudouridine(55) synthase TruB [Alphaproteobacteria bacterium]|nr:tRNA pseudouridine(55) synthase TruB [Alphaproteobacteria bacterium]
MNASKKQRANVHGWIVLDKPLGMTSTHAVAVVRRLLNAKKAGHAGTLDPLASGLLPLAFGEATKTVPYVVDGEKAYRFTVTFGIETDTDDSEGRIVSQSEARPTEQQILAALPKFTGAITQVPPRYSAIKIDGERAYDLARGGETVELQPRIVEIHTLTLLSFDGQSVVLEAECGKGTYVRAIARDLGRALGCFGYVTALRRTRVGPFTEADAVTLASLEADVFAPAAALKSIDTGLRELVEVPVGGDAPVRLRRGQSIILRGRDAPAEGEIVYATNAGQVIAIGTVERGELVPNRVFNL